MEKQQQRYTPIKTLAGSDGVTTVRARDEQTGADVVVRSLELRHAARWKAVELFEREVAAVASFDHPGVPRFVDSWITESTDGLELGLVREFVDGEPLYDGEWDGQPVFDEAEALEILREMGELLAYLHSLRPPVVHRDIRPEHIIRRSDDSLALVGFGNISAVLPRTVGGSTFVGTSGYCPPEQLVGRAMPASDVYALGASIVALLSGLSPDDMSRGMTLAYAEHVEVSEPTRRLLDAMVAPMAEDRIRDGHALLRRLQGPHDQNLALTNFPPPATMSVREQQGAIEATLPSIARSTRVLPLLGLVYAASAVFFVGSYAAQAFLGNQSVAAVVILAALFAAPVVLAMWTFGRPRRVVIDHDGVRAPGLLGRFTWNEIRDVHHTQMSGHGYVLSVEIDDGSRSVMNHLTRDEADWLVERIRDRWDELR